MQNLAVLTILDAAAKTVVVVAFAGALTLLLRYSSAAVRHAVWALAIAIALTLPCLSHLVPHLNLGISSPRAAFTLPQSRPASVQSTPMASALDVDPAIHTVPGDVSHDHGTVSAFHPELSESLGREEWWTVNGAVRGNSPITSCLFWVWVFGATIALMRMCHDSIRAYQLRMSSTEVKEGAWRLIFAEEVHSLGIHRRVQLLESESLVVPVTCGTLRPVVLLPCGFNVPHVERCRILRHELAHVIRFDLLTQAAGRLAFVLYWFHPCVWWALSRMHEEREKACDDSVLRHETVVSDYAGQLLALSQRVRGRELASTLGFLRRGSLEKRIEAILRSDCRREQLGTSRRIVFAIAAIVLATFISALPPTAAKDVAAASAQSSDERPASHPTTPSPGESTVAKDIGSRGVVILPVKHDAWRYWDQGDDINTNWKEAAFDDHEWKTGVAPLGYGDSHIATSLDFGPNPIAKRRTYFFRTAVDWSGDANVTQIAGRVLVDDGVKIYLNGEEIFRKNMVAAPLRYPSPVSQSVSGTDPEMTYWHFLLPATKLKVGKNIVAASLHQESSSSSDAGFDLGLTAVSDKIAEDIQQLIQFQSASLERATTRDNLLEITILVADHVLIWDQGVSKEVVTWARVEELIDQAPEPLRLWVLSATSSRPRYDEAVERAKVIVAAKREKVKSLGQGGTGSIVIRHYANVRTAEAFSPNQQRHINGLVLGVDGRPAVGAEVVMVFGDDHQINLTGGKIGRRIGHLVAVTDEKGAYSHLHPPDNNFTLVVIHPDGFTYARNNELSPTNELRLQQWGQLTVTVPPIDPNRITIGADLMVAIPNESGWPLIEIAHYEESRQPDNSFVFRHVAAGKATIYQSADLGDAGGMSYSAKELSIAAGQIESVTLDRFTPQQEEHVLSQGDWFDTNRQLAPGTLIPNFELTTLEGETLELSEFRGKLVVLHFCNASVPRFAQEIEELRISVEEYLKNGRVAIISFCGPADEERVRDYKEDHPLPWPFVILGRPPQDAENMAFMSPFLVNGFQGIRIVGTDGRLVRRHVSPSDLPKYIELDLNSK